jgi:hypothetical protein
MSREFRGAWQAVLVFASLSTFFSWMSELGARSPGKENGVRNRSSNTEARQT